MCVLVVACSPVPIIIGFVGTIVVLFVVVNVGLWYYAQQVSCSRGSKQGWCYGVVQLDYAWTFYAL